MPEIAAAGKSVVMSEAATRALQTVNYKRRAAFPHSISVGQSRDPSRALSPPHAAFDKVSVGLVLSDSPILDFLVRAVLCREVRRVYALCDTYSLFAVAADALLIMPRV